MFDLGNGMVLDEPPVIVVAVCHRCGAHTPEKGPDAIPLTESGRPGDRWTGVNIWGWLALAQHREVCIMRDEVPLASGHAPGWKWRKADAGQVEQPWSKDLPPHVDGLHEHGWHDDCPQAPLEQEAGPGQCSHPWHRRLVRRGT